MREWFLENWEFIASLLTVLVTCIASICGITVKLRGDKKALEISNNNLAMEKARLKTAIVEGSYIVCPKCGEIIYLKDVEVKIKNMEKVTE